MSVTFPSLETDSETDERYVSCLETDSETDERYTSMFRDSETDRQVAMHSCRGVHN